MTVEDMSQVYYINKEIKSLQLELASIRQNTNHYKGNIITDMPGGGESRDRGLEYTSEIMQLEDMIRYALIKLQREKRKAEELLRQVEDSETRLIIRLRCINNMHWEDIGEEVGMHRTTAMRKFYAYFKNLHTMHTTPVVK